MKKLIVLLGAVVALTSFSSVGFARQVKRLRLEMGDQHLRGSSVIKLKQEIRNQYPNFRLRNADLIKVRLVAKSKRGRGRASLVVGQQQSMDYIVNGNPQEFWDSANYTFDRVVIDNPSWDSTGRWQIHLQGNFIVRRVVVVVEKQGGYNPNPNPGYNQWQYVNTIEPPVGYYNTFYLQVNQQARAVKFVSHYGESKITEVFAYFGNGGSQRMSGLEGHVKKRDQKQQSFGNGYRYVQELQIKTSSRKWLKPGKFDVYVLTY